MSKEQAVATFNEYYKNLGEVEISLYKNESIKFFAADARKIKKPEDRRGTIVCNPPYGERLLTPKETETLYREVGKNFALLSPWQIYILSSCFDFEGLYGKRADKVRKLYNGMIPCNLYQYFKNNKIGERDAFIKNKPKY